MRNYVDDRIRTGLLLGLALVLALAIPPDAIAVTLKADRVTLNSPFSGGGSLTRVNFRQAYASPPLVFVLPTDDNSEPASLRVLNVTTTGFDVQQFEPEGEDGSTAATQIDYLAVSPGVHTLPGGITMVAGTTITNTHQGRNVPGAAWATLNFAAALAAPAALLLELQTNNNGTLTPAAPATPWLTVAARNVTATGAEIALERSETAVGTTPNAEVIAYLAIDSGTQTTFSDNAANPVVLEALRSANNITGWDNGCTNVVFSNTLANPHVVAHKSTRNGADGGWLRRCALGGAAVGLNVDEDQAQDSDRSHTSETASVVAASASFDASLAGGGWEMDRATLPSLNGGSLTFTTVLFPIPMDGVPVIFAEPTEGDPAPVSLRIRNVSTTGFQIAQVEPPGSGGSHASMTVDYIAVVPGVHRLANGTTFEAGFIDSTSIQRGGNVGGPQGWDTLTFTASFPSPPAFLTQLQTTNNNEPSPDPSGPFAPWLTTAVSALTTTGVQVALERSEADDGTVSSAERIGYLAFPANQHATLTSTGGAAITYDSRQVGNTVLGFDDGCYPVAYTAPFPSIPLAVGHSNTRNGNNGGWLRRCAISNTALSHHYDEDQDNDSERAHIAESVSQLAFSSAFEWRPFPDIVLVASLVTIDDFVSASDPKSIPGAVLDALTTVTNQGAGSADADTVTMTFPIDAATELFVGDLDGSGNAVALTDAPAPNASGLTWIPAAQIAFSNDGGTSFGYAPSGTYDPAVTHLRIAPSGTLSGSTAASTPQYTVRYRLRVR